VLAAVPAAAQDRLDAVAAAVDRAITPAEESAALEVAACRTGTPWGDIASDARVEPDLLVQDVAALWPDAARVTPSLGDAGRRPRPPRRPRALGPRRRRPRRRPPRSPGGSADA
jgi:hypothetical protein